MEEVARRKAVEVELAKARRDHGRAHAAWERGKEKIAKYKDQLVQGRSTTKLFSPPCSCVP